MKQKYYLRGLGLGILITSLVFIFVGPSELSEEEIIKRAEELGYTKVEEQIGPSIGIQELLSKETPIPEATPTILPTPIEPEPTEAVVPAPTKEPTTAPLETPSPTPTPVATPTPTETPVPTPTTKPEQVVIKAIILVEPGNTAGVVCDKIEAAGIISNGEVLKTYLINHNLTDYINVGSYSLSSDMTIKEIAKLLTEQ